MVNLVGLVGHRECAQRAARSIGRQLADLVLIVMINERLDRVDRRVNRARPENCWHKTGEPAGNTPKRQQDAALIERQQRAQAREMLTLGRQMFAREMPYLRVAGNCQDAEIDRHGARLARMVRAEVAEKAGNAFGKTGDGAGVETDSGKGGQVRAHNE